MHFDPAREIAGKGDSVRRLIVLAAVMAVLGIGSAAAAEPDRKHAAKQLWEWTADERLADRFDPERIRERDVAYAAKHPEINAAMGEQAIADRSDGRPPALVYGIDGARNPELFLPHELFDTLLSGLSPDESLREKQRVFYRPAIRKLGVNDQAFWPSLASVSGKYLIFLYGDQSSITGSSEEVQAWSNNRCRSRYDAMEAARQLFGRQFFNRFLYTVVAPSFQFSAATMDPNPVESLRREEDGCR